MHRHLHVHQHRVERSARAAAALHRLDRLLAVGGLRRRRTPHCSSMATAISMLTGLSSTISTARALQRAVRRRRRVGASAPAASAAGSGSSAQKQLPRPGGCRTPTSPPISCGQFAADRQAQAGAAVAPRGRLVGLREGLEQPRLRRRVDARAGVVHLEAHALRVRRRALEPHARRGSVNLSALARKLPRICRVRSGSPRTMPSARRRRAPARSARPLALRPARRRRAARRAAARAGRRARSRASSLPASIFDRSRMSEMMADRPARCRRSAPGTAGAALASASGAAPAAPGRAGRSAACGSRGWCWPGRRSWRGWRPRPRRARAASACSTWRRSVMSSTIQIVPPLAGCVGSMALPVHAAQEACCRRGAAPGRSISSRLAARQQRAERGADALVVARRWPRPRARSGRSARPAASRTSARSAGWRCTKRWSRVTAMPIEAFCRIASRSQPRRARPR